MKKEIKVKVKNLLEEIQNLDLYSQIEFIVLYGSALSNSYLKDSDIDICIYLSNKKNRKEFVEFRLELLKKIEENFDIQIFQLLPIYVQIEVLKGEILYVKDLDKMYEIAYNTIEEYEDFYPLFKDYIER